MIPAHEKVSSSSLPPAAPLPPPDGNGPNGGKRASFDPALPGYEEEDKEKEDGPVLSEWEQINAERIKAIKSTIAKTVIAVELSRSWTELIVIVRPIAFGQPLEIEHKPSCHEAVIILSIVFALASWVLYSVAQCKTWKAAGLVTTSCFMWSGASFSPTAMTCLALFPLHPLMAAAAYTATTAVMSIAILWVQEWLKEKGAHVIAQTAGLLSIFIVISAAAATNKAFAPAFLPWAQPGYLPSFLGKGDEHRALEEDLFDESDMAAPWSWSVNAVERRLNAVDGGNPYACLEAGALPNPFGLALMWALVVNGVLVRFVVDVVVGDNGLPLDKMQGALAQFALKVLAFFTGFQYVAAIKLGWKLVYGEAHDSLKMLSLEALTVFIIACCYIRFGKPLSGVAGLPKAVRLTRDETDKAFHDTAIGQSIGVSFTPVFQKLLDRVCLFGGEIEVMVMGHSAEEAEEAAYKQDWEIAAAVVYVALIITPLSVWLYYTFILVPVTPKEEKQNAAAAADDGGGDDGGDDGGGD